jgi:hypothetical protein
MHNICWATCSKAKQQGSGRICLTCVDLFAHAHFAFGGVGRISMQLIFVHHLKAKPPFLFKIANRQNQSHTQNSNNIKIKTKSMTI